MKLQLIGANGATFDTAKDACFGKLHDPRSPTCQACTFPVFVGDRVRLFNEVCGRFAKQGQLDPTDITRLSAAEVDARLSAGRTPAEIVREIIGEGDPDALFDQAWQIFSRRRFALRRQGRMVPSTSKQEARDDLGD